MLCYSPAVGAVFVCDHCTFVHKPTRPVFMVTIPLLKPSYTKNQQSNNLTQSPFTTLYCSPSLECKYGYFICVDTLHH